MGPAGSSQVMGCMVGESSLVAMVFPLVQAWVNLKPLFRQTAASPQGPRIRSPPITGQIGVTYPIFILPIYRDTS